ncbi:hypothetical protein LCGC14_1826310 [marine sediment metagenome]|uniref:Uncharacterized protein n=1 Tax=marine sediment metagenome TaxID=412755 RepID=A0A0F9GHF7_9ZZZZ
MVRIRSGNGLHSVPDPQAALEPAIVLRQLFLLPLTRARSPSVSQDLVMESAMRMSKIHKIWSALESIGADPALHYVPDGRYWFFDPDVSKSNGVIRESAGMCGSDIEKIIENVWDDLVRWHNQNPDKLGKEWQHLVVKKDKTKARRRWNGLVFENWAPPR